HRRVQWRGGVGRLLRYRFFRGGSNMTIYNRRTFVVGSAAAASVFMLPALAQKPKFPFRVAVITDEISPDFEHACHVASTEFGMHWVELRSMWGKNLMDLADDQVTEAQKILGKYSLQVTDIASPLFKTDWPGAPRSPYGSKGDMHGAATATFKEQDAILEK